MMDAADYIQAYGEGGLRAERLTKLAPAMEQPIAMTVAHSIR